MVMYCSVYECVELGVCVGWVGWVDQTVMQHGKTLHRVTCQ